MCKFGGIVIMKSEYAVFNGPPVQLDHLNIYILMYILYMSPLVYPVYELNCVHNSNSQMYLRSYSPLHHSWLFSSNLTNRTKHLRPTNTCVHIPPEPLAGFLF